jgi:HNH endonuclease
MSELIPCACGTCGMLIPSLDKQGRPRRYAQGHNRIKPDRMRFDKDGRVLVYVGKDHPMARSDGACFRARLVVAECLGRMLEPGEKVDHLNDDKQDDHPLNLVLFESQGNHMREHWKRRRESEAFERFKQRVREEREREDDG